MSEREPITAELRRVMNHTTMAGVPLVEIGEFEFGHRCDAIDAAHAGLERENAELRERLAVLDNERGNMHDGWVRLPVDADGVPIHIGDEMEGVDKYDSLKEVKGKVITVSFESDGIVDVAIRAWNSDGKSWHRAYLDSGASVYRHHHAPTVEDVLREFAYGLGVPVADSYVAATAAKLRLAGDAS